MMDPKALAAKIKVRMEEKVQPSPQQPPVRVSPEDFAARLRTKLERTGLTLPVVPSVPSSQAPAVPKLKRRSVKDPRGWMSESPAKVTEADIVNWLDSNRVTGHGYHGAVFWDYEGVIDPHGFRWYFHWAPDGHLELDEDHPERVQGRHFTGRVMPTTPQIQEALERWLAKYVVLAKRSPRGTGRTVGDAGVK